MPDVVHFLDTPDPDPATHGQAAPSIVAHAVEPLDPAQIPPRRWLYGRHMVRGFVSATVAPGGVGKTALSMSEALAIVTGRELLGCRPSESGPVWFLSLEDPADEFQRRLAGACLHHGIDTADLRGKVFATHGRDGGVCLAKSGRTGVIVNRKAVEGIKAQIRQHKIALLAIDPFIACHDVDERDNGAVNSVLALWREIAEATDCAVELIHHTRKANGNETTADDARGASSFHGALRSMRVINGMSEAEAIRAGIDLESRRQFFRVDRGKTSLTPPGGKAEWYRLESVDLGNGIDGRPSDSVGVVARWEWPDPLDGVTVTALDRVCAIVDAAEPPFRPSSQASNWIGHCVAEVLQLDPANPQHRARIATILATWFASGALRKIDGLWRDETRRFRPIVRSQAYQPPTTSKE